MNREFPISSADSFIVYPMEKHEFLGGGNDYLCAECSRPRAMHLTDGFRASAAPSKLPRDPGLYRGPHPHFMVRSVPSSELYHSNPRRHAWAMAEMKRQRQEMEAIISRLG